MDRIKIVNLRTQCCHQKPALGGPGMKVMMANGVKPHNLSTMTVIKKKQTTKHKAQYDTNKKM